MNTMKKTPRHTVLEILNRVEEQDAFAEPLLDAALSRAPLMNIHDRSLITHIVYGTLRMRGRLDWIIDQLYKGDFLSMDVSIKNILRAGLYQLLFTDRIPDFAVVDEAVEIAKKTNPAGSGLVNAILRNAIRKRDRFAYPDIREDPAYHLSVLHSHPLWIVRKWIEKFGVEETTLLCKANNEIPPVVLRVNTLKTNREKLIDECSRQDMEVKATGYSLDGMIISHPAMPVREMAFYKAGHFQIQDEASQLISRLVDPKPGENVLDVCAGTGGKTTHLAAIMNNRGRITALDIGEKKIMALRKNAGRLGATNIDTRIGDAREMSEESFYGSFDKILVDAPCTGLGTLRRNPEIKWRITEGGPKRFSVLQKAILTCAARSLKKGGLLIYSTCTIATEENEEVIADFTAHHPDFICIHPPDAINSFLVDDRGYFRSYPHKHGIDGFFGAVLIKKNGQEKKSQ
jgi:16S rRNA (cytosine967-C5)-methyltransferase